MVGLYSVLSAVGIVGSYAVDLGSVVVVARDGVAMKIKAEDAEVDGLVCFGVVGSHGGGERWFC